MDAETIVLKAPVPLPAPPVRIDLGCGRIRLPGFIGVDRFPMPGVDIVADLDAGLPFADDSVDLILASHSLEHVRNLAGVIREISRVCKHGAQLCIIAPYHAQALNLANPYHFHAFNEHTPRFWTASPVTTVDPAEYSHPHARDWGLLESDNSAPDIDIRCVKMEFFYFPAFRELPVVEQRTCRKQQLDVCDQLVYHLLVLKQPVSDEEFFQMAHDMEPFESPYIALRRLQDHCEQVERDRTEAVAYANRLETQVAEGLRYKDKIEHEFSALEDQLQEARRYKEKLECSFREVTAWKDKVENDYSELFREKSQVEVDCRQAREACEEACREVERLRAAVAQVEGEVAALEVECATLRQIEAALTAEPGHRLWQFLRRVRQNVAPPHSFRDRFFRLILNRRPAREARPAA